jgi:MerR family transcriptional regulator, light-induced transcriptional regulator
MSQLEDQTSAERCHSHQFDFVGALQQLSQKGLGQSQNPRDNPLAKLLSTIETEIIPRLMLAHVTPALAPTFTEVHEGKPGEQAVAEFTRIVLDDDALLASSYIQATQAQGVSLEAIYLHLFAPTARRLGEMWEKDECGFAEVTIGLCRLHAVLREFSLGHESEGLLRDVDRSVMLLPAPGDQHTFGITMVSEFFRNAGWNVLNAPAMSSDELVSMVSREWFDVIGLSLSSEVWLDGLGAVIHSVRKRSRNRELGIMVGGPIFVNRPELAMLVGADATACDGRHAVLQANRLVTLIAARCQRQYVPG